MNEEFERIDKVGMPHVMDFIVERLRPFDTRPLDWMKLLPLHRNVLLHGARDYPYTPPSGKRGHGYRIRASVNTEMAPPFVYLHWGRVEAPHNKRGWVSGEQEFLFDDLEECAVHTLAHECFHYLSASEQVEEKNTEANANWWADQWLAEFRQWR